MLCLLGFLLPLAIVTVVPRGGGHGRGRGRGRGKAEPKAKTKAAKSKASPKRPARASEGRALVKVNEGPVDTKGKLSNLVTQGKAAANKLAKQGAH